MDLYEEIITDNRSKEINPVSFGWHKNPPCHSFGPFIRTHWLTLLKAKAFLYATAKHII